MLGFAKSKPETGAERTVVITGASRGLGLASAAALYRHGWQVVAAVRSPERGLENLLRATGAHERDPKLRVVRLDLDDLEGMGKAAAEILDLVGVPDVLVHNAGIAAAGAAEDTPISAWEHLFRTNVLGPVALTNALLPTMREAGKGHIVVVSSMAAVRGMPSVGAYGASKAALERWAEALASEVGPFGVGVTILVAGSFQTSIITEETPDHGDHAGPYGKLYGRIQAAGRSAVAKAAPPEMFGEKLAALLEDPRPFSRLAMGGDARQLLAGARLLPARTLHAIVNRAMNLPSFGALSPDKAT